MGKFFSSLAEEFDFVFIQGNRYQQMIDGVLNTLKITAGALLVGIVIGIVVASIRSSYDKNKEAMKRRGGIGYGILTVLNAI